jgi:hypothetical protein
MRVALVPNDVNDLESEAEKKTKKHTNKSDGEHRPMHRQDLGWSCESSVLRTVHLQICSISSEKYESMIERIANEPLSSFMIFV